jgi:hypothetical protein
MQNTATYKLVGSAVLCALLSFPLVGCGSSVGSAASEAALPDEPGTEPVLPGQQDQDIDPAQDSAPEANPAVEPSVLEKYNYLDPGHIVPDDLLAAAVKYYDANLAKIGNKNYLSVINFAAKSTKARFFIIDMKTGKVWAIHVAHGKGSDPEHDGLATMFSNVSGSNKSSLGVYKTAETYSGNHGLSLRLDGLSSTNSKARARAIVLHGADYVQESSVIQGRSLGCPAVAMENRDKVVAQLKGGSIIYAGLAGK